MNPIRQIFDKKSPVLIITIATLIAAIIAAFEPSNSSCELNQQMEYLEKAIIVIGIVQVIMKTAGLEIIKRCSDQDIGCQHTVIIMVILLVNLGLWIWSIRLNLQIQKQQQCKINDDPHVFFLEYYSILYMVIYSFLAGLLLCLNFQSKVITLFEAENL